MTRDHDHSIAQAQRARDKHDHGVAKQSRAHEHSAAAAATAPSSTAAKRDSSSTPTSVIALVLLLRTACAELDIVSRNAIRGINTTIRYMMNCTEILKTNYRVCTWWIQRVVMSCGQPVTGTRALSSSSRNPHQHSSNPRFEQHSYACCFCCVLLRTARGALERTSMSRF